MIVIEHSTESAPASDRSVVIEEAAIGNDESVSDALVVSLAMIVRDELPNGSSQCILSKENHPFQTGLFNAADEAFCVAVQVG